MADIEDPKSTLKYLQDKRRTAHELRYVIEELEINMSNMRTSSHFVSGQFASQIAMFKSDLALEESRLEMIQGAIKDLEEGNRPSVSATRVYLTLLMAIFTGVGAVLTNSDDITNIGGILMTIAVIAVISGIWCCLKSMDSGKELQDHLIAAKVSGRGIIAAKKVDELEAYEKTATIMLDKAKVAKTQTKLFEKRSRNLLTFGFIVAFGGFVALKLGLDFSGVLASPW